MSRSDQLGVYTCRCLLCCILLDCFWCLELLLHPFCYNRHCADETEVYARFIACSMLLCSMWLLQVCLLLQNLVKSNHIREMCAFTQSVCASRALRFAHSARKMPWGVAEGTADRTKCFHNWHLNCRIGFMVLRMSDVGVVMDRHIAALKQLPAAVAGLQQPRHLAVRCKGFWGRAAHTQAQHEKGTVANEPAMPPGACHAGCPIPLACALSFPGVMWFT